MPLRVLLCTVCHVKLCLYLSQAHVLVILCGFCVRSYNDFISAEHIKPSFIPTTMATSKHYLIVGGGPVGLTMAIEVSGFSPHGAKKLFCCLIYFINRHCGEAIVLPLWIVAWPISEIGLFSAIELCFTQTLTLTYVRLCPVFLFRADCFCI